MSHNRSVTETKHRSKSGVALKSAEQHPAGEKDVSIVRHALLVQPHPERQQLISEAAYHKAEARGFESGHELEDWLAAEAEVDARLYGERAT